MDHFYNIFGHQNPCPANYIVGYIEEEEFNNILVILNKIHRKTMKMIIGYEKIRN